MVDGPRLHPLVHGRQPAVRHPSVAVDDLAYVNEAPGETVRRWAPLRAVEWHSLEAQIRRTVHVRDDFVQIPFPRLASTSERQIAEAVEQYKKEAAIIDPRLAREVTLSVRAIAFSDLCDRLRADTGIEISADPGVADEKVTIFCEKRPLREVMREITHVFGFTWLRSGAEGEYRYQLMQDLRSQLAEEQLRNQDVQQALLDLDKQMSIYRPYLDQSVDQLLARLDQLQPGWEKLSQEEKGRLWTLIANGNLQSLSGGRQYPLISRLVKSGGWGPAMLYFRLSPAERSTLLAGGRLEFSMDDPNPERRLPADWRVPLLKSTGLRVFPSGVILQSYGAPPDKPSTPVDQAPNTEPVVNLELDRSEAGELTLKGGTYVNNVDPSTEKIISADGVRWTMATGRSPSTTKPDNAAANQALRTKSLFRRVIDLQPRPSCPRLAADEERARKGEPDPLYQMAFDPELRGPHVNTADVWEAIHQRTGLPVVADSYLHIFPLSSVTVKQSSTFDALCQVGDQMGVRWKKEGDFLLGRSTSYFWDELKEVPNRLLRRWQQDSRANNGLPLADLLEMASLSDQQLGSKTVGEQICHCWELDEWQIVGTGPMLPLSAQRLYGVDVRKYARVLSMLTPAQLKQAQQPEGVALADLKAAPREALLERFQYLLSDLPASTPLRLQVDYIPSGSFIWSPLITMAQFKAGADRWPTIWGTSVEKALAAARRYDPNAEAGSMRPTGGRLDFTFVLPDGKRLSTGGPGVMVETG